MNIYKINFRKLIDLLLPISLRKETLTAFLRSLISPLKMMHTSFTQFRANTTQKMSYNSQTVYLRAMLNDYFDRSFRRILIEEVQNKQPLMIFRRQENKPVMLGIRMLPRRDVITNNIGFIVIVPQSLQNRENEIISYINFYKLVTIGYTIKYV